MTKQELQDKLKLLQEDYQKAVRNAKVMYATTNNPVKKGDVVSDSHTTIKVEKIGYDLTMNPAPSCYYIGAMVKKDGTPFKSKAEATVWQENLITN